MTSTETLKSIANYVLPVYKINDEQYVKLEYANALRDMAKEALESLKGNK